MPLPERGVLALAQPMLLANSKTASIRSRSRCPTWGFFVQIGSSTRWTSAVSIEATEKLPIIGKAYLLNVESHSRREPSPFHCADFTSTY